MKHTPGPWIQWADTNIIIRLHSGGPFSEDLRICEVATNTKDDQGRYNAMLISAAPDLLDALQLALKALDAIGDDMTVGERWTNAGQHLLDALMPAKKAIAKAIGE